MILAGEHFPWAGSQAKGLARHGADSWGGFFKRQRVGAGSSEANALRAFARFTGFLVDFSYNSGSAACAGAEMRLDVAE